MVTGNEQQRQTKHSANSQVTILPPVFGHAPFPPEALTPALNSLEALQSGPRDPRDAAVDVVRDTMRKVISAVINEPFRERAHGLSTRETQAWLAKANTLLSESDLDILCTYARACWVWLEQLRDVVTDDASDPDWDMDSANNVWPNKAEQYLADTLIAAGIPVQHQVGVSRYGGARRGGWFGSYWLDCAHRDVRYGLRIDIELDGREHQQGDRPVRDVQRNGHLQKRGWYIVRIPGAVLRSPALHNAIQDVVALAQQHRRAVILARSDVALVERELGAAALQMPGHEYSVLAQLLSEICIIEEQNMCPCCGNRLVERIARRGPHPGQKFYGCASYPHCRYVRNIDA